MQLAPLRVHSPKHRVRRKHTTRGLSALWSPVGAVARRPGQSPLSSDGKGRGGALNAKRWAASRVRAKSGSHRWHPQEKKNSQRKGMVSLTRPLARPWPRSSGSRQLTLRWPRPGQQQSTNQRPRSVVGSRRLTLCLPRQRTISNTALCPTRGRAGRTTLASVSANRSSHQT